MSQEHSGLSLGSICHVYFRIKSFRVPRSRVPHDVMRVQRKRSVGQYVIFPVASWREFLAVTCSSLPEQPETERLAIEERESEKHRMSRGAECREQKLAERCADR